MPLHHPPVTRSAPNEPIRVVFAKIVNPSHLYFSVIAVESVRVALYEDLAKRSGLHFAMRTVPDVAFIARAIETTEFVGTRCKFVAGVIPRNALVLITNNVESAIAVWRIIAALEYGSRIRAVRIDFADFATARLAIFLALPDASVNPFHAA
jgi:hypothetical protein